MRFGSRACFGFALIENDFAGFAYPTPLLGLKTVVSHELFHGIQNAYDSEQDSRWSEGSAVWAEEIAFPEQDDYERFVSAFLEKPSRPLRPSRLGRHLAIRFRTARLYGQRF